MLTIMGGGGGDDPDRAKLEEIERDLDNVREEMKDADEILLMQARSLKISIESK